MNLRKSWYRSIENRLLRNVQNLNDSFANNHERVFYKKYFFVSPRIIVTHPKVFNNNNNKKKIMKSVGLQQGRITTVQNHIHKKTRTATMVFISFWTIFSLDYYYINIPFYFYHTYFFVIICWIEIINCRRADNNSRTKISYYYWEFLELESTSLSIATKIYFHVSDFDLAPFFVLSVWKYVDITNIV